MLTKDILLALMVPCLVLVYVFYSWLTHKDR